MSRDWTERYLGQSARTLRDGLGELEESPASEVSRAERDYGDLGRTIEPEWNAHGAYAAIDVELQSAKPEPTLDVLPSHRWQNHCAKQGQANLAPMAVSAEH